MIIILMGVSGAGKTTIGQLLADQFGWPFFDGDNVHPPQNIQKMRNGVALNDEDRQPWLESIGQLIDELLGDGASAVIACSALKRSYRKRLRTSSQVNFVYLRGDSEIISKRMAARSGHYMPLDLLKSQLETLDEPTNAIVVDIDNTPEMIVKHILSNEIFGKSVTEAPK